MIKDQCLLDFIGNTPLIKANKILNKEGVSLYLKLEGNNPGGSVKDRPAYNMILAAFERNDIKKGDYLIVEDSNINGHPVLSEFGEGPMEAILEYLQKYPQDYQWDAERENKFGFTFAPRGFFIRQ